MNCQGLLVGSITGGIMKHKVTKRPKRVKIKYEEIKAYTSNYTCPTCQVEYHGGGPARSVVRFICACGQELIVDR